MVIRASVPSLRYINLSQITDIDDSIKNIWESVREKLFVLIRRKPQNIKIPL
jgi:hypothetical protein